MACQHADYVLRVIKTIIFRYEMNQAGFKLSRRIGYILGKVRLKSSLKHFGKARWNNYLGRIGLRVLGKDR